MKIRLQLPVEVIIPRKMSMGVKYIVNLNNYGHWKNRGDAKIMYAEAVRKELAIVWKGERFEECYLLFIHRPKNNNIDTANVLSVVEKFACDAIQDKKDKKCKKIILEKRLIKDDSRKEVKATFYFAGELDKSNPHVEMIIFDNKEEYLEEIKKCLMSKNTLF